MTKLFHVKIQVKKTKIYALFDLGSQENLIAVDIVRKLGLEVRGHPYPYPLGWVHKDVDLYITKQCKIRFSISVDFIDELDLDVVPLDVCGAIFGSLYMYVHDVIFMWIDN